jgi:hypothetical protein
MKLITQDKSTTPYTYSFNVEVSQWPVDIFRKTLQALINLTTKIDKFDNNQLTKSSTKIDGFINKISPNSLSSKKNQNPKENIKEIYIKKSIKEKDNFSKISLFKNKKSNFREYLKEPVHIGELIKEEFGEEVRR